MLDINYCEKYKLNGCANDRLNQLKNTNIVEWIHYKLNMEYIIKINGKILI